MILVWLLHSRCCADSINFNYLLTIKKRRDALRQEAKESVALDTVTPGLGDPFAAATYSETVKTPPLHNVMQAAHERRRRSSIAAELQRMAEMHNKTVRE